MEKIIPVGGILSEILHLFQKKSFFHPQVPCPGTENEGFLKILSNGFFFQNAILLRYCIQLHIQAHESDSGEMDVADVKNRERIVAQECSSN